MSSRFGGAGRESGQRLPVRVPRLWPEVDLIATMRLPAVINQLHIADRARWRRYFEEGKRLLQEASEPIPFAGPGMIHVSGT